MFPARPGPYQHLVDLDHVACPRLGPLGNPLTARERLRPHGLDIAWNVRGRFFVVIRWINAAAWESKVPCVVWTATDIQTGKAVALTEQFIAQAIAIHRSRCTVEEALRAEEEADRDRAREVENEIGEAAEETVKEIVDTERVRSEQIAVP